MSACRQNSFRVIPLCFHCSTRVNIRWVFVIVFFSVNYDAIKPRKRCTWSGGYTLTANITRGKWHYMLRNKWHHLTEIATIDLGTVISEYLLFSGTLHSCNSPVYQYPYECLHTADGCSCRADLFSLLADFLVRYYVGPSDL